MLLCYTSLNFIIGDGLNETKDALLRIGAQTPLSPGENGSFAFLGYTGPQNVNWLNQVSRQRRQGPSQISDFILTPAAVKEISQESSGDERDDHRERTVSSEDDEIKHSARVSGN